MTLSLETSEEMRDRPLLQPVQDFQIGSIYRRQLRDGVSGLGGGSATGRQQRKQHSHRQLRLSSAGALSNGSAAGRDGMNSMRSLYEQEGFRHMDAFRELSRMVRLQLPPTFAEVYRRRNMI
jgi:hypothetical protein